METGYIRMSGAMISHEADIVWLEDPLAHPYLREVTVEAETRRGPVDWSNAKVIGYSVLHDTAEDDFGFYRRRVWHVHFGDPYEGSGHPCEAVDPTSIQVGRNSRASTR